MNNKKMIIFQILMSAVVGALVCLVLWGIFRSGWSILLGFCAFALINAYFDLNPIIHTGADRDK